MEKEYLMLREEILQYLKEYQTVRNMMYVITITILGFCINGKNTNYYFYLLPVIVILPSYIVAFDYRKCVVVAAAYLDLFHEKEIYPFKWESRHSKFNIKNIGYGETDYQSIPYIICEFTCIGLYVINSLYENMCIKNILIGITISLISIFVFIRYGRVNYEKAKKEWERIYNEESRNK